MLIENLEGSRNVGRLFELDVSQPGISCQPFLEVNHEAVIIGTLGNRGRKHPFRQSEPKCDGGDEQDAISKDKSPHHAITQRGVDRSSNSLDYGRHWRPPSDHAQKCSGKFSF